MKRYNKETDDCLAHFTIFNKVIYRLKNIKHYYGNDDFLGTNKIVYKKHIFKIRKYFAYTTHVKFKIIMEDLYSFIDKRYKNIS